VHNRTLDVTTNLASLASKARVDTEEMGKKSLNQDSGKFLLSNYDISLSLALNSPLSSKKSVSLSLSQNQKRAINIYEKKM
jgi:hypothetical protein